MPHKEPETQLITIGLTCYNAENTIERAINSALAQTWPNKEILVVDDVSSDNSGKVVSGLAKTRPEIRLITHEKNVGPGGARQTLLNEARGEFIAFFDDDDESLPDRIAEQYQRITQYENETGEELIACYAGGRRIYPNNYIKPLPAIGSKPEVPHGPGMADSVLFYGRRKKWYYGSGTPTCSLMARCDVLRRVGGFDPSFRRVEDMDLTVRLALAGCHFIGCDKELFIQYATWAGDKSAEKNLEAEQKLAEKYKDYLQEADRYYYALNWPKVRYWHFKRSYWKMLAVLWKLFLRHPLKITVHFLDTGPKRFLHERKMAKKN